MSKVDSIERDVEALDESSFAAFRDWFVEYDNARWDRQIESDSTGGKLDRIVGEALGEHRAGKAIPL